LLESFDVDIAEAQELVMTARLMLGWVTEEQIAEDAAAKEGDGTGSENFEESGA
jgi:N utilization substance protein A